MMLRFSRMYADNKPSEISKNQFNNIRIIVL